MSNGGKTVVFNTKERVISSDHNRLQDMQSRARGNMMQRLIGDRYTDTNAGLAVQNPGVAGGDTPLDADVIGGLMVQPNDPSSLLIQPGTIGLIIEDATVGLDDSPYKIIDDPGITSLGILTFTAAGASTRIDVVECSVVDTVQETDNRDIFDPATGLFTPQLVNKVVEKRLQYRIRVGTAGAGYPGHATGWLPLAIASVPSTASDFDDVTFWDVRPLVQDRISGNSAIERQSTGICFGIAKQMQEVQLPTPGEAHFEGSAWREFDGYWAGGRLNKTTPTATMGSGDLDYIDFQTTENRLGSESVVEDFRPTAIVCLFPEGLPRWVRYTETPGSRVPMMTRGIIAMGDQANVTINGFGRVTAAIPPVGTGLTASSEGVLIGYSRDSSDPIDQFTIIDNVIWYGADILIPTFAQVINNWEFTIDPSATIGNGSFVPPNVSEALFEVVGTLTGSGEWTHQMLARRASNNISIGKNTLTEVFVNGAGRTLAAPVWMPFVVCDSDGGSIESTKYTMVNTGGATVDSIDAVYIRALRMAF